MKKGKALPYILILPMFLIMVFLIYFPTAGTFYYSLMKMNLLLPNLNGFAGFTNYIENFKDPVVWSSFYNSVILLILVLALTVIVGMAVAFLLKKDTPITGVLLAVAIIPWSLPPIVSGMIWRWLFHPSYGLINSILLRLDMISQPIQWLSSHYLIILTVALTVAWKAIPLAALVLFSALQGIPPELYEAAEVDGCNGYTRFSRITLPLLRPALGIVLTTTSITGIGVFDEIVSLTGYSNVNSTLMMEVYIKTFQNMNFGSGSALIYIVMLASAVISIFYVKSVYKEVAYL